MSFFLQAGADVLLRSSLETPLRIYTETTCISVALSSGAVIDDEDG
jgi:hypothetical protein